MPNTNIKFINYSDSQSDILSKLNNNFDEMVEIHGGTLGDVGPTGPQGSIGPMGIFGPTGVSGERGNRWLISTLQPSGNSQEGDYWIDSNTSKIYQLLSSGWAYTGYNAGSSGTIFSTTDSLFSSGGTGTSIQMDQAILDQYLFILSDSTPESSILDELLSKFVISVDTSLNQSPILEFSKSNIENGTTIDYTKHPYFKWDSPSFSDNTLSLFVPGGSANFGASGGNSFSFDELNLNSNKDISISYGVDSSSGIYSTGGYNLIASNGDFNINSTNISIAGGSGSMYSLQSNANLGESTPSIYIYAGGTSGFKSIRTGETISQLSSSYYHIVLGLFYNNQILIPFYLNGKGKLKTNKTIEGLSYPYETPGATGMDGANLINWYFVSRTSSTVNSSVLSDGNTMIISPNINQGEYLGIGLYSDSLYSWGSTGGIEPGQSIDMKIYCSTFANSPSDGFSYIGIGATSGGSILNKVSLPFRASAVDFTVARGVTGSSVTTVYYRAYGSGASGGSFTF